MKGHTNSASGTKAISNPNVCAITVEYPQGCSCILRQDTREFTAPSGGTSYTFYVDYGTWEAVCSDGTFEYKDSVTVDYEESAKLILGKFLILESPSSFTLTPGDGTMPGKDGTLEYSTNASTWTAWDEVAELTAGSYHDKYVLYLRGTGNTKLTGDSGGGSVGNRGWHITGSNVTVKGNIATLLDWQTVAAGSLPTISRGAFAFLFGHATNSPGTALKYAHELVIPYDQLSNVCCSYMFYSQSALVTAPKLPAARFGNQVYASMFAADSALVEAPALPATALSTNCYKWMFNNCTSLITLPALPATELPEGCYQEMFKGATQIALSTSREAAGYPYLYTIPAEESSVSAGTNALASMFYSTGGTFTGAPSLDYKYTTKNSVIEPWPVTASQNNLLKNWYFVGGGSQLGIGHFPINTNGQTSYSGAGYGIDKWLDENSNSATQVNSNSITFRETSGSSWAVLLQTCNRATLDTLLGKTATFTVLTTEGLYTRTFTFPTDTSTNFETQHLLIAPGVVACVSIFFNSQSYQLCRIIATDGSSVNLIAVKLELGNTQTLAHQENGVWVLNEIPDYYEQLAICQL